MSSTKTASIRGVTSKLLYVRGLLPIIVGLALWELLGNPDDLTFPPPSEWMSSLQEMRESGALGSALLYTVRTFLIALALATLIGVAVGSLVGSSAVLERASGVLFELLRSVPPPAIVPVVGLVLGISLKASVVIVVLATVWPILLNTTEGMNGIPRVRMDVRHALRIGRWDSWRKIVFPSLVPSVLAGLRVATPVALIVALIGEMLGGSDGIGLLLSQRRSAFDAAGTWGLLLIIGLFGYLVGIVVSLAERKALRAWGLATD